MSNTDIDPNEVITMIVHGYRDTFDTKPVESAIIHGNFEQRSEQLLAFVNLAPWGSIGVENIS